MVSYDGISKGEVNDTKINKNNQDLGVFLGKVGDIL